MQRSIYYKFCLFVIAALFCLHANADTLTKSFELLAPPHITDPYVIDIPFRVDEEGMVNVYVTFSQTNNKKVKNIAAMLMQDVNKGRRAHTKVGRNSSAEMKYAVDSLNLKQTRKFFVRLANHNPAGYARGQVTIEYPGRTKNMPDLVVTNARTDSFCQVIFTLKNNGKGVVPLAAWNKKAPVELAIERNNRPWGAAALRVIDPSKKLLHPGGFAHYKSQLKAPTQGNENIAVVLDPKNRVRELNEQNNRQNFTLKCAMPDLIVSKLYLDKECHVVAELQNRGTGKLLPSHFQNDGAMVSILRDGKSWGGSAIGLVDPNRKLTHPNGKAVYRSNLKINNQETKIQVRIDSTNKVDESNENNNFRNKVLKCAPNAPKLIKPMQPMKLNIQ